MVAAAVIGSAVVGAGAGLYGASQSAKASKEAAQIQADSAAQAGQQQLAIYQQNRADTLPWLQQGQAGLTKLSDLLGTSGNTGATGYGSLLQPFTTEQFQTDPGYNFALQQGQQALDRAASRAGSFYSGGQLKAATRFNQGLANQQYDAAYNRYNQNQSNIYNRLAGLSGTGQTAAQQVASQGQNYANNMSDLITGAGNAQAAGTVGAANAWSTGLQGVGTAANSGVQNYLLSNYLNNKSYLG